MAQSIRDVMTADPIRLPADTSVRDAARQMRDNDIGDIIVEKDGRLYGIVTDRDIVVRVVAEDKDLRTTDLQSICSQDVATLTADQTVKDATQLMKDKALRRIPVVDPDEQGKVIGIVSLGDVAVEKHPKSALGKISAASANT
jgi:CBS domain-containing protein